MSLQQYLEDRGFYAMEGYSQQIPEQVNDLNFIIKKTCDLLYDKTINVMEIGFNAGHSAEIFLKSHNNLTLISFDLNMYNYVQMGKEYINKTYTNRHELIIGDSKITIPDFINKNQNKKFDIIFIDGGHDYETAKADIENCFYLAHKDTIVILDDTMFTQDNTWVEFWNIGPTKVWSEQLLENKIFQLNSKNYNPGRGMSWGKYIFL